MKRREFENLIHCQLLSRGRRLQRSTPAPRGWQAAEAYGDLPYLRCLNFGPATIIDVGVAEGTPDLYDVFPEAYLMLIELIADFADFIAAMDRAGSEVCDILDIGRAHSSHVIFFDLIFQGIQDRK